MVVFIKGQLSTYKENRRVSIHRKSHRYTQGNNTGCGTNHDLLNFSCCGIGYRKVFFSNFIRIYSNGEAHSIKNIEI